MNSVTPGSLAPTQGSQPSAPSLSKVKILADAVSQQPSNAQITRPTGGEPRLAPGRVSALVDRFSQVPTPLPFVPRQAAQRKANGMGDRVSCFGAFLQPKAPAAPAPAKPQQPLLQQSRGPAVMAQTVVPVAQPSASQGRIRITSKLRRPIREALPPELRIKPTIGERASFLPENSGEAVRVTSKAEQPSDPDPLLRRSKRLAPSEEAVHDTSTSKEQKRHASATLGDKPKVNNHRRPPTNYKFKK